MRTPDERKTVDERIADQLARSLAKSSGAPGPRAVAQTGPRAARLVPLSPRSGGRGRKHSSERPRGTARSVVLVPDLERHPAVEMPLDVRDVYRQPAALGRPATRDCVRGERAIRGARVRRVAQMR